MYQVDDTGGRRLEGSALTSVIANLKEAIKSNVEQYKVFQTIPSQEGYYRGLIEAQRDVVKALELLED